MTLIPAHRCQAFTACEVASTCKAAQNFSACCAGGAAAVEAALQQVLTRCCGAATLLEIGCGSSGLAERAHILVFRHILASDISSVSLTV